MLIKCLNTIRIETTGDVFKIMYLISLGEHIKTEWKNISQDMIHELI